MHDNARLAALILDQINGNHDIIIDEAEFVGLLKTALEDGQSRLDLRDRLIEGARDSNEVTLTDIIDVISQSLSDEIRDLSEEVSEMENDLLPSRLALGSMVGLVLGTLVTLAYGASDPITSAGLIGALAAATLAVTHYRKRTFRKISALRVERTNYENFRRLLHDIK